MSRQQILQGWKTLDRRTKIFTISAAFAATEYTTKPLRSRKAGKNAGTAHQVRT